MQVFLRKLNNYLFSYFSFNQEIKIPFERVEFFNHWTFNP